MNKEKISKSGTSLRLDAFIEKGYDPLAYRYLVLTSHYRSHLSFTWESLDAAQTALKRLKAKVSALPEGGKVDQTYVERFMSLINNDLAMPQALALMWELLGSALNDADKKATARYFDRVFGLELDKVEEEEIPREILELVELRLQMKKQKEYQQADEIRQKVAELGYRVNDAGDGSTVSKQG